MKNQRVLTIPTGENFRELGGYPAANGQSVKWHKLLRAGHLGLLSKSDLKTLENYGVRYDVDLRSKPEVDMLADQVETQSIEYIFDPVFKEDATDNSKTPAEMKDLLESHPTYGRDHMENVYRSMINTEHCRQAFYKLFQILLKNHENDQAVLFHCTAGKDRTGMSATFILSALGVDQKTIEEDYLLTNQVSKPVIDARLEKAKKEGYTEPALKSLRFLYSVSPDFFNAAMDEINKLYGGMKQFLHQGIGLTDNDIKKLRKIYLE
ncbi:tyrosine-protein phosphatase [Fructilactobacillus fructivorans]|uniref:Protein-tyrosine-phosphatase n=2 Tax=Fructilactobacillus fructivorans TaxID=1614 RepID=A0AAE6P176_9LACO|nr:tyrosine-protein phosphatase [Fructilactobacillus fructivorans]QFX93131.1 protein-tyrosine-phosphatase [Fructilactobacillus fructivorans]RDV64747.1 protein-tyrosine-phosphatase [Fructilactobacillus fructivorans]